MNNTVRLPARLSFAASATTRRKSATPALTAESAWKFAPVECAITCASVVSSPWPCEAIPKLPVTAPVESRRIVADSVPVLIGMPGAAEMREEADQANGMVVKMLTHDLLGGLAVEVEGSAARLRLPASREQLDALATLASAMLPPEATPAP